MVNRLYITCVGASFGNSNLDKHFAQELKGKDKCADLEGHAHSSCTLLEGVHLVTLGLGRRLGKVCPGLF